MKYIDADKLKAHIEAKMEILWDRLPEADKEHLTDIELRDLGMYMALECLIDDLDSLQQEQPEEPDKSLEEEVKNYFQCYWPGTETAEQCNTDLHFTPLAILRLARHFAEWQKQQMIKGAVEFECIGKKVKMTVEELINYYIDTECCGVADECGF